MLEDIQRQLHQAAEHERLLRISTAWARYNGDHPASLKKLPESDPKGQDNVTVNYARLIVDKGVGFLFGKDVTLQVDDQAKSDTDTWLQDCLAANRWMTTIQRLGINGGVCGHTFLKLRLPEPAKGKPYPRIVVLDPANVTVFVRPDDWEEVDRYVIQWHGMDTASKPPRAVAYRQTIEPDGSGWHITDEKNEGNSSQWTLLNEEPWPYPFAPILGCQNLPAPNEYWGLADLEADVLAVNASLNFVLSNLNRIIRFHAHPKTWGSGFEVGKAKTSPDQMLVFPDKDAKLQNLEMLSDLSSSLELYRELKCALHEISRIPEVATGKVENLGQLSGLALQILYGPLVELTAQKRLLYGDMLEELGRRLLILGGKTEKHRVKAQWPNVLPTDAKGDADTGLIYVDLGISKDTVQTRLGFDPEEERQKKAKEIATEAALGTQLLTAFDRGLADNPEDPAAPP